VKSFVKEFRDFIARGNVVDIAIAFIIATAFAAVVKSLTENVVMPIVAIPFGKPDFRSSLIITIHHAQIKVGSFITDVIVFVLVAFVLFLIVKAYNRLTNRTKTVADTEIDLLTQIRDELRARSN
jgi:large conductance mechanosensitive channel